MTERTGGRGKCAVCGDDRQAEIDAELVSGKSYGEVSRRYGISRPALTAHKVNHMTSALVKVPRAELVARRDVGESPAEVISGESVAAQARRLLDSCWAALERAQAGGNSLQVAVAQREARGALELLAKLLVHLDRVVPVLDLQRDPGYCNTRSLIMAALAPFPTALRAVQDAFGVAEALDQTRAMSYTEVEALLTARGHQVGWQDRRGGGT